MLQWKTGLYHLILSKRKREAGIFQPLFCRDVRYRLKISAVSYIQGPKYKIQTV